MRSRESHLQRASDKYQSILWAAVLAIVRHGVRGMSLRDVAAEAGTSLTLISHHFGSKSELLNATIASLLGRLRQPVSALSCALDAMSEPGIADIVDAWLHHAEDAFASEVGFTYLRLMLRLQVDEEVEAAVADHLDASLPLVRRALRRACPYATARTLDLARTAASGSLYECLREAGRDDEPGGWQRRSPALREFLIGGIEAIVASSRAPSPDRIKDEPRAD